jgi:hypothetical protein
MFSAATIMLKLTTATQGRLGSSRILLQSAGRFDNATKHECETHAGRLRGI